MKIKLTKNNTVNILNLTLDEIDAIIKITTAANDRCFFAKEDNGAGVNHYYSGDDFVCVITEGERIALSNVCREFEYVVGRVNYN